MLIKTSMTSAPDGLLLTVLFIAYLPSGAS